MNETSARASASILPARVAAGSVVFVGSSISLHSPSRMPRAAELVEVSANALARRAASVVLSPRGRHALRQFAAAAALMNPEAFYARIGEGLGRAARDGIAQLASMQGELNDYHRLLGHALASGRVEVITTNWDTLIERSTRAVNACWRAGDDAHGWESYRPGTSTLLHLHGSFSEPASITLTLDELERGLHPTLARALIALIEGVICMSSVTAAVTLMLPAS